MDDLVKMVAEKAGISETQAKLAVKTVFEMVDDKIPAPIAAQLRKSLGIDTGGMLGGVAGDVMSGNFGGLADAAKGMFGK